MHQKSGLRVIFAGTPTFAAQHLEALLTSRHSVVAVYTQPDRPAGRGKKLQASPVKRLALEHNLPVAQPQTLKGDSEQRALAEINADIMIVVAYGLMLPPAVLSTPHHGCINVHASLLPRWRGAAPIQRAIESGDKETGVTLMQMDAGLDTGAMLKQLSCAIEDDDTAERLFSKLATLGCRCLLEVLEEIQNGEVQAQVQNDEFATYAEKISKTEAQIDWHLPAVELHRKIRAYNPFPIAYSFLNVGTQPQRIKIYRADIVKNPSQPARAGEIVDIDSGPSGGIVVACGDGALRVRVLQLPGKKALSAEQLLLGHRDWFPVGACFEQQAL